jgi:hypothetical protein
MAATAILTHGLDYLALKPNATPTTLNYEVLSTGKVLAGFPAQYEGERVWLGSEMALKEHEFIVILSEEEKAQVQNALRHFQSKYQISPVFSTLLTLHDKRFERRPRTHLSENLPPF